MSRPKPTLVPLRDPLADPAFTRLCSLAWEAAQDTTGFSMTAQLLSGKRATIVIADDWDD